LHPLREVRINVGQSQEVNVALFEETKQLDELVFKAPEDPSYPIMRKLLARKKQHDIRYVKSYMTENYTKLEFDVSDFPEKMQKRQLVQKAKKAIDSIASYKTKDGSPVFPIFISESISKTYVDNNPRRRHEDIIKANIQGIAIDNKKQVAQITGVTFQEYNFYQNWMRIIDKDFVSPLADNWKLYYDYYLDDSAYVDNHYSYKILFYPKVEADLAFQGHMWVTKKEFALKEIDATVTSKANLNFIQYIHIIQKLSPTEQTHWMPTFTDFEVHIAEIAPNFPGAIAKFIINTTDWTLNEDYPAETFILPVEVSQDAVKASPEFWNKVRPVPLTESELDAINAIKAVEDIRQVKVIAETVKAVKRGYVRQGKIDYGPWLYLWSYNNIEGNRLRFGFRTNDLFSEKWVFSSYVAYGFRDQKVKYGGSAQHIFSRKPYTTLTLSHSFDVEQLGVLDEDDRTNFIFTAATRLGTLANPHELAFTNLKFQTDIARGITQTFEYRRSAFQPLFPFAYITNPGEDVQVIREDYVASEVIAETRITKHERFIYDNNFRVRVGLPKRPIVTARYTLGINGFLGSNLEYHKFQLRLDHLVNLGLLGTGIYAVEGGYIPSDIPYPVLKNHIGNTTVFLNNDAFNVMNFGEFVSDRYVFLKYQQRFQGFILNRIPLMRRLKWRTVAYYNILFGGLRDSNRDLIPEFDLQGRPTADFKSLGSLPYMEVGYGVENIFKFFTFSVFHRLTYINEDANKWGIRLLFSIRA
jgi:hypothetical protein